MSSYLLILGDREALGWVLTSSRMAFPARNRSEVSSLTVGDQLFIYTTRGAFRNPTRDRGRVIGTPTVRNAVKALERPMHFCDREYPVGCDLEIGAIAPLGSGVELAPLVPVLETFAKVGGAWSILLRRMLLRISPADAKRLGVELKERLDGQPSDTNVIDAYARWYHAARIAQ